MRPISLPDLMKNLTSGSTASSSLHGSCPPISPFAILSNASRGSLPVLAPSSVASSTFYFDADANSRTATRTNIQRSTNVHVCVSLLMPVVGAGMLSLPFTFAVLLPTQAAAIVVVVGISMALTAHALLSAYTAAATKTKDDTVNVGAGHIDLASLASHAVSRRFGILVSVAFAAGIVGGCVGSVRIARDMMPHIGALAYEIICTGHYATLPASTRTTIETALLWAAFGLVVFPLCILRSLSALRLPKVCALACSVLMIALVVYRSATSPPLRYAAMADLLAIPNINDTDASGRMGQIPQSDTLHFPRVTQAVSIFSYAFTMHLNLLPLFLQLGGADNNGEARIANRKRLVTKCIVTITLLSMALYIIFGIFASRLYGGVTSVQGNIITNMRTDPSMRLPLVVVFFVVLLSFPPLFHPGRVIVQELLTQKPAAHLRWKSRIITAVGLLAAELLVATWVPSIDVVFAFVGATMTVFNCYVIPVFLFTALYPWRETRRGQLWCGLLWGIVAVAVTMGMRTVVFLLTDA